MTSFMCASKELKADEEFMMKVANFNGAVYHVASWKLCENRDFGLTTCNRSVRRGEKSDLGYAYSGEDVTFDLFANQLRRTSFCLLKHAVFEWLIRPAMALPANTMCPITLLNTGGAPHEHLIEDFVGVPRGQKLERLKCCFPKELDLLEKRRKKYPLSSHIFFIS